jgi:hypothetical protein
MPHEAAIHEAVRLIRGARYLTAFTGAGISVESGIPPFRGEGGLWNHYDPRMLELDYFRAPQPGARDAHGLGGPGLAEDRDHPECRFCVIELMRD